MDYKFAVQCLHVRTGQWVTISEFLTKEAAEATAIEYRQGEPLVKYRVVPL